MKILTTGLALALLSLPVFAQSFDSNEEREERKEEREARLEKQSIHEKSLSPFTGGASIGTTINDAINENHAIGAAARQSNYTNGIPATYGQSATIKTPAYNYHGYSAPAYPYPYPAYGYPVPYPYPAYGYPAPYPYPYPANTITSAPIAPPQYSWERPAYITSVPLGTTYYYNNGRPHPYPNYPNYYNYPPYGYGYTQSSNASVSIGNNNFRLKVGSSTTTVR
jgi:hypothetical protein